MLLRLVLAGGPIAPRRALLMKLGHPLGDATPDRQVCRDVGLDELQIERLGRPEQAFWRRARDWLEWPGNRLVGWQDPDYPALLRQAPNPPLALFVAGDPTHLWLPSIAIVGSRSPTRSGCDHADAFARALVQQDIGVVSGLATGIDTAAHMGALSVAGGHTVAVLGTGPDIAYPSGNTKLQARIGKEGVIVSEFPPGVPPRAAHFPARNRIVAGLALGVLVVEAAEHSGALITARLAAESGREVFALPGSIHNPMARGCHRLIREGATLVESIDEILESVTAVAMELGGALRQRLASSNPNPKQAPKAPGQQIATPVSPMPAIQRRVWKALEHDPISVDALSERTGLTAAELSAILLQMELEGWIAVEYGRCSRRSSSVRSGG